MKKTIEGSEAITSALLRARIERNVLHEPMPKEMIFGMGFFSGENHTEGAHFIWEKKLDNLEKLLEMEAVHNTTNIIFILGDRIDSKLLHNILAYSLPVFATDDVETLFNMIGDVAIYSRLHNSSAIIYVPYRVLVARKKVNITGLYRSFCDYDRLSINIKKSRIKEIEERYFTCVGSGDIVVISNGRTYQYLHEILNLNKVKLVNVEMLSTNRLSTLHGAKTYVVVGALSKYFARFFPKCHEVKIPGNELLVSTEISKQMLEVLDSKDKDALNKYVGLKELLYVKKPSLSEINTDMCAGCKHRANFLEVINDEKVDPERVYVDIYCEKLGHKVVTGHNTRKTHYDAQVIFTNQPNPKYDEKCVILSFFNCDREIHSGRNYQIDRKLCTNCKNCIEKMRCPAIHIKQGKVSIDSSHCNACGMCATLCSENAIREGMNV